MLCLRLRMRRMCSLGMGLLGLLGLLRVGCLSMCCVGSRHLAIGPVRSRYILHVHLTILRHHLVNHLCLRCGTRMARMARVARMARMARVAHGPLAPPLSWDHLKHGHRLTFFFFFTLSPWKYVSIES